MKEKDKDNKPNTDLDPSKVEVLDKVAEFVVKRNLEIIAIMLLESSKPLHYLGAQALIFFEPFLDILFSGEKIQTFREAMEEKKYVEYLINKIEESSD